MRLASAALAFVLTCGLALDASPQQITERWYVLHCGALLQTPGQAPLAKVSLLVKGGRVQEVRSGFIDARTIERPAEVEVVTLDLREAFVMPGLVDAHVHLTVEYGPDSARRAPPGSDAEATLRTLSFAQKLLGAGFTTVRDLGSRGDAVFAVRNAIRQGAFAGPRLVVAGEPITATGGHSDLSFDENEDPLAAVLHGVADGPLEVRKAVRQQVKRGADVIKLTATSGVLSDNRSATDQTMFDDELKEIVATARQLGRRVAAHAHGPAGIKAALRAGVDSIEHGTYLDDEAISLFKQSGAFLVPTVLAGETVSERAKVAGYYSPVVQRKAAEVGPRMKRALQLAHAQGVRIAFGTDSGVAPHGENAREFSYMVQAGMSEMQAIQAATVNAAELLGLSAEVGTLEPGKAADVIATSRNPLVDITELQRVVFVMRNGRIFKNDPAGKPGAR